MKLNEVPSQTTKVINQIEGRQYKQITEIITSDGVLNLQAKNISNSRTGPNRGSEEDKAINLDRMFNRNNEQRLDQRSFSRVQKLNLSSNRIRTINDQFCSAFGQLQVLDIRANKVQSISHKIRSLKSLQVLKLDKNQLVSLPLELFDLPNIIVLSFSQNRINTIPNNIQNLT